MGKKVHDDVLDGALNILKNNVDVMTANSAEPSDYSDAAVTTMLAQVALDSSDFTIGNGDVSGRKVTVASKSSTVNSSGTATHVALLDSGEEDLLYVTTCTSQGLTAPNAITWPAWDIEIADPS